MNTLHWEGHSNPLAKPKGVGLHGWEGTFVTYKRNSLSSNKRCLETICMLNVISKINYDVKINLRNHKLIPFGNLWNEPTTNPEGQVFIMNGWDVSLQATNPIANLILHITELYSLKSFKIIGDFPKVLNSNRLFLIQSNLVSTTLVKTTPSVLRHIFARPNFLVQNSFENFTYHWELYDN